MNVKEAAEYLGIARALGMQVVYLVREEVAA